MGTNVNQYVKSFMDDYNVTQLTRDALGKIIQNNCSVASHAGA